MCEKANFDINRKEDLLDIEIEEIKYRLYMQNKGVRHILIVSTVEKEGKSKILLDLATSIAKDNKNVLVMIPEGADFLGYNMPFGEILKTNAGIDLYHEKENKEIVQKNVDNYDYVLTEAPALMKSNAGIKLTEKSELVLLVVQTNRTSWRTIRTNVEKLKIGECKNIQVVLNKLQKNYGVLKVRG